jgi:hypothetical protein
MGSMRTKVNAFPLVDGCLSSWLVHVSTSIIYLLFNLGKNHGFEP